MKKKPARGTPKKHRGGRKKLMETKYHTDGAVGNAEPVLSAEAEYRRELKKLSDSAFVFLSAAGGNPALAESLLDDFIDLVFEGGALSTWRYRILLAQLREGL